MGKDARTLEDVYSIIHLDMQGDQKYKPHKQFAVFSQLLYINL